jgi:hypothetical protein
MPAWHGCAPCNPFSTPTPTTTTTFTHVPCLLVGWQAAEEERPGGHARSLPGGAAGSVPAHAGRSAGAAGGRRWWAGRGVGRAQGPDAALPSPPDAKGSSKPSLLPVRARARPSPPPPVKVQPGCTTTPPPHLAAPACLPAWLRRDSSPRAGVPGPQRPYRQDVRRVQLVECVGGWVAVCVGRGVDNAAEGGGCGGLQPGTAALPAHLAQPATCSSHSFHRSPTSAAPPARPSPAASAVEHILVEGARHAVSQGPAHLAFLEVGPRCPHRLQSLVFCEDGRRAACLAPFLSHACLPAPVRRTLPPRRASPSSCARCRRGAPRRCASEWRRRRRRRRRSARAPTTRSGRPSFSSWTCWTSGLPRCVLEGGWIVWGEGVVSAGSCGKADAAVLLRRGQRLPACGVGACKAGKHSALAVEAAHQPSCPQPTPSPRQPPARAASSLC